MNVLFIFRNAEWLGIEYLSAMLKKRGHRTDLIFDPGSGDIEYKIPFLKTKKIVQRRFWEKIHSFKPDLFCFSALMNLFTWCRETVAFLKANFSDVPVIVGGLHPTMFPETVINTPGIDMICLGEGEDALLELCNSMENKECRTDILNIWFEKDGSVIKNPIRPLRQDLDSLPFPDKDIFYRYGCFRNRIYVMTGRGCPYDCSYCFNHTYKELYRNGGRYVRQRSVENCIDELSYFRSRYNFSEIFFYDDTFTLNHDWVEKFCESYRKHIRLPFALNVRANTVTRGIMKTLKKAGCYYVVMGVESGDEYVRNVLMKRNLSDEVMLRAAQDIHAEGIKLATLNVVGVPTETPHQMWKTVEFNWRLRPDGGSMASTFYPFPKTGLYDLAVQTGHLDGEGIKRVHSGEGSYREDTILKHPHARVIKKVVTFEPIMVRLPKFLHPLLKRMPPLLLLRLFSVLFYSPRRHLYYRIKEFFLMQYYSLKREGIAKVNR